MLWRGTEHSILQVLEVMIRGLECSHDSPLLLPLHMLGHTQGYSLSFLRWHRRERMSFFLSETRDRLRDVLLRIVVDWEQPGVGGRQLDSCWGKGPPSPFPTIELLNWGVTLSHCTFIYFNVRTFHIQTFGQITSTIHLIFFSCLGRP